MLLRGSDHGVALSLQGTSRKENQQTRQDPHPHPPAATDWAEGHVSHACTTADTVRSLIRKETRTLISTSSNAMPPASATPAKSCPPRKHHILGG